MTLVLCRGDLADEMRLNSHRVATGMRTGCDAEHKDRTPKLIESVNFLSASSDVPEHRFGLRAVRVAHAFEIGDAKYKDRVSLSNGSTVDIFDARWLGGGHDT